MEKIGEQFDVTVYPKIGESPVLEEVVATLRRLGYKEGPSFLRDASQITGRIRLRWAELEGSTAVRFSFLFGSADYVTEKHKDELSMAVYKVLYGKRERQLVVTALVKNELQIGGVGAAAE